MSPAYDNVGTRWLPRLWVCLLVLPSLEIAPAAQPPADTQPAEEEDLADRLIRQTVGEEDQGVMSEILRLMDRSTRQLHGDFDPGRRTQAVQWRIIEKLDEAIATAQRRKSRSSSSVQPSGDRRTTPPQPERDQDQDTSAAAGDDQPPDTTATTTVDGQGAAAGRFREPRRGWGHLPARDRDEMLQGIDEDVLEKYRQLIDDYFRALAEDEEE
jgi:hypothetical protein